MDTFRDVYEKHYDAVYRLALFLTGPPDRADDLAADTFVRAWTARDRLQYATVRAYLAFGIALATGVTGRRIPNPGVIIGVVFAAGAAATWIAAFFGNAEALVSRADRRKRVGLFFFVFSCFRACPVTGWRPLVAPAARVCR